MEDESAMEDAYSNASLFVPLFHHAIEHKMKKIENIAKTDFDLKLITLWKIAKIHTLENFISNNNKK